MYITEKEYQEDKIKYSHPLYTLDYENKQCTLNDLENIVYIIKEHFFKHYFDSCIEEDTYKMLKSNFDKNDFVIVDFEIGNVGLRHSYNKFKVVPSFALPHISYKTLDLDKQSTKMLADTYIPSPKEYTFGMFIKFKTREQATLAKLLLKV